MSFLAFVGIMSPLLANDTQSKSVQLVKSVVESIDNANSYTYELVSYERVNGEIEYDRIAFTVGFEPYRVRLDCLEKPHKGVRINFDEMDGSGKARVNPGLFIPTIKMDPLSKKMRKNNHHSVLDAGFRIIRQQLASYISEGTVPSKNSSNTIKYGGEIEFNGINCEKLTIEHSDFRYESYTVKSGEDLYEIAHKLHISEYLIRERNEKYRDWDTDVAGGETIMIPNYYSKKTILYIDKSNMHPIYQEMFDENGMFEKYLFLKLRVNPVLTDSDFSI